MTSGVISFQYKNNFCSWKFPLANYSCSLWPFINTLQNRYNSLLQIIVVLFDHLPPHLKIWTRDGHIESSQRKSIVLEQDRCQYSASFLVQCRHLVSEEVELILATNTSHSCVDKVTLYNNNLYECPGWSMCLHHLIVRHRHIYLTVVAYIGTEQHFKITKGVNGGSHDTVMLSLKYPMVTMQIGTTMLKDNGVRDIWFNPHKWSLVNEVIMVAGIV